MEERTISIIERNFDENERFRIDFLKGMGISMNNHHYHNFYEIYYMVDGKGTYFINDKLYDIIAGDIVIVPPNTIHSTDYQNKEYERVLLEFTDGLLPKSIRDKLKLLPSLYRHAGISHEVYIILREIEREYKEPDDFSVESINYLINRFIILLLRNLPAVKPVHSRDAVISEVITFIKENYRTNITLAQLAEMHFISPEHLSRSFKKETNFGFNEFISLVRLQQAENLLKNRGNISIAEVAYACGFNDSNYFSDKFKKNYGVSPLQYSKSFKIGKSQRVRSLKKKK